MQGQRSVSSGHIVAAQMVGAGLGMLRNRAGRAKVDYGQLWVWIGAQPEKIHLFVLTLGYSRRLCARAYRDERLTSLLHGHEHAFAGLAA